MFRRTSDRGNRIGSAYALTTFARILPGREDELEAYLEALPIGAESPFARLETLHIARVQIFRALVHQGPKQKKTDVLQNAHLVFTSTIDGDLDPYLDVLAERVPECDDWWGRCAGYPGRSDQRAFRAYVRSIQARPGLFQSAMPERDRGRGARGAGAARAGDRLRRRGPGPRRGDAAGTLPLRVLMLGRPPNVPRRERKPAHIDLDDIQGNVLRGYTLPAAAYLFLRIVDVEPARRLMTRMLPHVMTAETWSERPGSAMNVAFTYAGLERLGLPDAILDSFPPVFREGMAARAEHLGDRGPSAPAHWEAGLGTGEAHVLVTVYAADDEQLRAAVAEVIEEDAEQQAVSLVHLQRARGARPAAATISASSTGSPSPRCEGAGVSARPGDGQPDGAGGWRDAGHRRGRARLRRRGRHAARRAAGAVRPQRHVRRLPQAAHGPGRVPALHRASAGYPGGPDALAAKIVGRWPDGTPLSVSPDAPDAGDRRRPAADQRLRLRRRPARPALPARRPRPPHQPARLDRLLRRPPVQPPPDRPPRPRLRPPARPPAC